MLNGYPPEYAQATLLSYFRTFIEDFAKRVGVNRTEGSLRSYRNAYNHVERFMREKYNLSDTVCFIHETKKPRELIPEAYYQSIP